MGDYSKLIVACSVKKSVQAELEGKIADLGLYTSAYQSGERVVSLEPDKYSSNELNVVLVGQTKWGDGQKEFCEWLKPHVTQGSGLNEVYALSFSEYSDEPTVWKLEDPAQKSE